MNTSSVGNALLNTAVNNAPNTITANFGNYGTWILVAGIILLLIIAYSLFVRQKSISEIIPQLRREKPGFGENWCFVGEDITGRWCVRVPRPDACSPDRLFSSRPGCELVSASPLPLGLVADGGAAMRPLVAAAHIK